MLRSLYRIIRAMLKGEDYEVAFEVEIQLIDVLFGIAATVLLIVLVILEL